MHKLSAHTHTRARARARARARVQTPSLARTHSKLNDRLAVLSKAASRAGKNQWSCFWFSEIEQGSASHCIPNWQPGPLTGRIPRRRRSMFSFLLFQLKLRQLLSVDHGRKLLETLRTVLKPITKKWAAQGERSSVRRISHPGVQTQRASVREPQATAKGVLKLLGGSWIV